jgi:hypothetical protein
MMDFSSLETVLYATGIFVLSNLRCIVVKTGLIINPSVKLRTFMVLIV